MEKMHKVYSDKENYGVWWVDDTTDYYYFKAINIMTNEEKNYILSWTRSIDIKEEENVVRIYDVEIEINGELKKYYFNFYYDKGRYRVVAKDPLELEKLLRETDITFVGETGNPDN
jgi:hypothetical protein